jgi:hypothetical protein
VCKKLRIFRSYNNDAESFNALGYLTVIPTRKISNICSKRRDIGLKHAERMAITLYYIKIVILIAFRCSE